MHEATQRPLIATTWEELKRRRVVRAAVSYAVVAFIVLQLAEITFAPLGLPERALTWTVLAAILGFPVVMSVAWYFDATPQGLERDTTNPARKATARLFAMLVVLLTVAGLGFWLTRAFPLQGGAPATAAPPNSIAVLPFEDLSPQRDQRWFGDGLAEELLDRLARVPGLNVAARTSSFAFRDRAANVREIGSALDVAYVLEGSVRKAGERLRVTAQLIDAQSGFHRWSQTYERDARDIFALQDEITADIVRRLGESVAGLGEAPPVAKTTRPGAVVVDVRAHELYLEGRQYWRQRTPAALAKARELFEQAVARDAEFARAWSGLSDTYLLEVDYGLRDPQQGIQQAEPAAVRAVTLDPELGEAWASLGLLRMTAGQYQGAKANLLRAIELDPRYAMAPMWLARILEVEGNFTQRREVLERALALSPHEPVIVVNLAQARAAAGETQAARDLIEDALAVVPGDPLLLRAIAIVERDAGRLDRAVAAAHAAQRADPDAPANLELLIQAEAELGEYTRARAFADRLAPGSVQRALARQELLLREGAVALDPEFAARLDEVLGSRGEPTGTARAVLTLAGLMKLRAAEPQAAIPYLERAAGERDQMAAQLDRYDAASLLALALRRAGRVDEANAWEETLRRGMARWIDQAPPGPFYAFLRALAASMDDRVPAAVSALDEAVRKGWRAHWQLRYDPRLDRLHGDPGFEALERRLAREIQQQRRAARRDA